MRTSHQAHHRFRVAGGKKNRVFRESGTVGRILIARTHDARARNRSQRIRSTSPSLLFRIRRSFFCILLRGLHATALYTQTNVSRRSSLCPSCSAHVSPMHG